MEYGFPEVPDYVNFARSCITRRRVLRGITQYDDLRTYLDADAGHSATRVQMRRPLGSVGDASMRSTWIGNRCLSQHYYGVIRRPWADRTRARWAAKDDSMKR